MRKTLVASLLLAAAPLAWAGPADGQPGPEPAPTPAPVATQEAASKSVAKP